jgi:hypothetical protein
VEVGGHENSLEEVRRTLPYLAQALAELDLPATLKQEDGSHMMVKKYMALAFCLGLVALLFYCGINLAEQGSKSLLGVEETLTKSPRGGIFLNRN